MVYLFIYLLLLLLFFFFTSDLDRLAKLVKKYRLAYRQTSFIFKFLKISKISFHSISCSTRVSVNTKALQLRYMAQTIKPKLKNNKKASDNCG